MICRDTLRVKWQTTGASRFWSVSLQRYPAASPKRKVAIELGVVRVVGGGECFWPINFYVEFTYHNREKVGFSSGRAVFSLVFIVLLFEVLFLRFVANQSTSIPSQTHAATIIEL